MTAQQIRQSLCREFCDGFYVEVVPVGYAISTPFRAADGDPITFFARRDGNAWQLEDDGDYLACAAARGIGFESGMRARLLDAALHQHGAFWDRETYQIKSSRLVAGDPAPASVEFLSALIRARDIEMLSQERVASTFAEDAEAAIERALGDDYEIVDDEDDVPADILVRRISEKQPRAAVYLVTDNAKLLAALLRHQEKHSADLTVIALLESLEKSISRKYFAAAQNRGLQMPIYDASPTESIGRVCQLVTTEGAATPLAH